MGMVMLDFNQRQVLFGGTLAGIAACEVVRVHIGCQELRFDAENLFVMPDSIFERS